MSELLTAAQMRAIEQAAINSGEVTGLELMERAGAGVVEAILEEWPEMALTTQKVVVLCGPGNNGGDGFVVARLLKQRGWKVEVFLYGKIEKLPVDAAVNAKRWLEMGEINSIFEYKFDSSARNSVLIDALFGAGLTRALSDELVDHIVDAFFSEFVVSIDVPSGLCLDSGSQLGRCWVNEVWHDSGFLTVTFHRKRIGQCIADGPELCGKIVVADLQIAPKQGRLALADFHQIRPVNLDYYIKIARESFWDCYNHKSNRDNKYTHGHALIVSGPSGKTGAGRLAARGALRIGAGVVTLASPPDAMLENAAQVTAIMLTPVADAVAFARVLQDTRINALCLGPALGLDRRDMVEVALKSHRKLVLDADALSMFADDPKALFDMLHEKCVLTPHAGEFKRMFPDIAAKLAETPTKGPAYSKVDATRDAAKRAGCVVLYKGADTVIADPTGSAAINSAHFERAAPWLATAGSGDVLAGFITGLLARGVEPMHAAQTAAWLHVECALKFGPGLIAEDIPEQLPAVFRALDV
ncbi:MAG: NAD(P)H-hydrate dehydratase [Paracoccaceae bacterium]